uniref:Integrase catalytic domain-containing protein n=1 Tax=Trichuris muris TaxID=70415 RepID=A0A5S6R5R5_TRIMR
MDPDIVQFCKQCQVCQRFKPARPVKAPLQNMPIGRPRERLGVDILELPESTADNRYALAVQDYFTKWQRAFPLHNQTASTVAKQLVQLFHQMGPPEILHTGQGRTFESSVLKEVWYAFGVKKTRTTPYHPQGDGPVERTNRTILQILRTLAEKDSQWDELLPAAALSYNTSQHTSTGFTPYEMMFGRQHFGMNRMADRNQQFRYDTSSYHDQLLTRMNKAFYMAKFNLAQAAERQRRGYNARIDVKRIFHVGDAVWLYR